MWLGTSCRGVVHEEGNGRHFSRFLRSDGFLIQGVAPSLVWLGCLPPAIVAPGGGSGMWGCWHLSGAEPSPPPPFSPSNFHGVSLHACYSIKRRTSCCIMYPGRPTTGGLPGRVTAPKPLWEGLPARPLLAKGPLVRVTHSHHITQM